MNELIRIAWYIKLKKIFLPRGKEEEKGPSLVQIYGT